MKRLLKEKKEDLDKLKVQSKMKEHEKFKLNDYLKELIKIGKNMGLEQ